MKKWEWTHPVDAEGMKVGKQREQKYYLGTLDSTPRPRSRKRSSSSVKSVCQTMLAFSAGTNSDVGREISRALTAASTKVLNIYAYGVRTTFPLLTNDGPVFSTRSTPLFSVKPLQAAPIATLYSERQPRISTRFTFSARSGRIQMIRRNKEKGNIAEGARFR